MVMSNTDAREQRAGAAPDEQAGAGAGEAARPAVAGRQAAGGLVAGGYRRRRGGWVAAGVVVVLVLAGAGVALAAGVFAKSGRAGAGPSGGGGYRTSTAAVTRRSLTSQTVVNATLGKAGTWTVVVPQTSSSSGSGSGSGGSGSGTFTWLPRVGRTVFQGQRIYAVSGVPVVLLYGSIPAYRDLSQGLSGADVTELNTDLVRLGYAASAALGPRSGWDYYSAETASAVAALQGKLGLAQTGTLSLGQAAFLPGPALVTGWGTTAVMGAGAAPGTVVLTASSTTPLVTIGLDAGQQAEVKAGDAISVTLPDGTSTPGVITQVSRVASASSSGGSTGSTGSSNSNSAANGSSGATITVLAALRHPKAAGRLNSAPVTVTITQTSVANVLTVPVDALLAQVGSRYQVEVTGPGGHHFVTVTPGLFDNAAGLVQVTGDLAPGQRVVVPGA
jgi:peptidoglycan hydrolase-like protein with peptidoglycan-binding domain